MADEKRRKIKRMETRGKRKQYDVQRTMLRPPLRRLEKGENIEYSGAKGAKGPATNVKIKEAATYIQMRLHGATDLRLRRKARSSRKRKLSRCG